LPSGDQVGAISRTAGVSVRLRAAPSLTGTVKTSPRASKTARAALGERSTRPTFAFTSFHCGAAVSRAAPSMIGMRSDFSVVRSRRWRYPPFMKTMAPGPRLGHNTSYSVKFVTLRTAFVARSQA
jgi:hypothetical protein